MLAFVPAFMLAFHLRLRSRLVCADVSLAFALAFAFGCIFFNLLLHSFMHDPCVLNIRRRRIGKSNEGNKGDARLNVIKYKIKYLFS